MATEFFALMNRMRYITRWGLMRNTYSENLQEHSFQVAVLAHGLALIRRNVLGLPGPDPDKCAVAALFHDVSETLTGDLPTPIKYYSSEIRNAYKDLEHVSGNRILDMLPDSMRESYAPLILEEAEGVMPTVKAADKLAAYLKCIEEQKVGNTEFESAARQTRAILDSLDMPEMKWFLRECLPAYLLNIDQL